MKIQFDEGPEVIRTDEGDIKRGEPFKASDVLGERLLEHHHYKFHIVEEPAKSSRKKKGGIKE
jgi:hypothetical protein